MNILIITDNFYPKTGGVAKYDQAIASALALNGNNVWVLTTNGEVKDNFPFTVVRYPRLNMLSSFIPLIYSLALIINKNIDIVVLGYFMSGQGLGGLIGKKLGLNRLITVVCGYDLVYSRRTMADRLIANSIMRGSDRVLTDSGYTGRKVYEEFNNKDRVFTLYPAVSEEFLNMETPSGKNSGQKILTVSRLVEGKGLTILLEAFAIVKRQLPKTELDIVGEGPLRQLLLDLAKNLGLSDSVNLLGNLSQKDLLKAYSDCDLFVMASEQDPGGRFEGFGIVFLEASACGKSVVGTKHGGIPEAVEDGVTGILVEPGNINRLANAMIKLIGNDTLRDEMGKAGHERVVNNFNWTKVSNRLEKLLSELL